MKTVLVAGTHGWRGSLDTAVDWYYPGSALVQFLRSRGVTPLFSPAEDRFGPYPFVWSTGLDGVYGKNATWVAGGVNLFYFCVPPLCPERRVPPNQLAIVAHSHGGQAALHALALGLKAEVLVTLFTPVRADMTSVIAKARPNVKTWVHVYSDASDWMQWLGGLFDGQIGVRRQQPRADQNVYLKDVGHSNLLRDPDYFHHWVDVGLVDLLKGITNG